MKNVLLLGDSIRINYQDTVIAELGDEYAVCKPEENCRFSKFTLNSLRMWLPGFPKPDIIHWNNGLWDVFEIYPEDGCFTAIDEYVRDMMRILRELKKTGAKVIFATTTPVKEDYVNRKNENIRLYNRRITAEMEKEGVPVNNLHRLVSEYAQEYIREDKVHLSDAGMAACGKAVADAIRAVDVL